MRLFIVKARSWYSGPFFAYQLTQQCDNKKSEKYKTKNKRGNLPRVVEFPTEKIRKKGNKGRKSKG